VHTAPIDRADEGRKVRVLNALMKELREDILPTAEGFRPDFNRRC